MPFLILGNKIDLPQAVSEEHLRMALNLMSTTGKVSPFLSHPVQVFLCRVPIRFPPTSVPLKCLCVLWCVDRALVKGSAGSLATSNRGVRDVCVQVTC